MSADLVLEEGAPSAVEQAFSKASLRFRCGDRRGAYEAFLPVITHYRDVQRHLPEPYEVLYNSLIVSDAIAEGFVTVDQLELALPAAA